MTTLYDHPKYYHLAFAWRNVRQEVAVLAELSRRFGRGEAGRVLELACGHAPHAEAWLDIGWRHVGIDVNPRMVDAARHRLFGRSGSEVFEGDMRCFTLAAPVDLAVVLLGSLYVRSGHELRQHLETVAAVLSPGGLYVWDWCVQYGPIHGHAEQWTVEQDGVRVEVSAAMTRSTEDAALLDEHLRVRVNDHGRRFELHEHALRLAIAPADLPRLLDGSGFTIVGAWNDWNLDEPVARAPRINRPIVALRRGQDQ